MLILLFSIEGRSCQPYSSSFDTNLSGVKQQQVGVVLKGVELPLLHHLLQLLLLRLDVVQRVPAKVVQLEKRSRLVTLTLFCIKQRYLMRLDLH